MSQRITYPESAPATKEVISSDADKTFLPLPEAENLQLAVPSLLGTATSLDDRMAFDRKLVQFVLTESEAAFTSPVRHFFIPGGQQLQYNHN